MSMVVIILLIVVATAVWVGADASGRDWSGNRWARSWFGWTFGTLVLWIVVFPVYLAQRGRAPRKVA